MNCEFPNFGVIISNILAYLLHKVEILGGIENKDKNT